MDFRSFSVAELKKMVPLFFEINWPTLVKQFPVRNSSSI